MIISNIHKYNATITLLCFVYINIPSNSEERMRYPFDIRYSLESIHVVMSGIELSLSQRYHVIKMNQQVAINLLGKTRLNSS